MGKQINRNNFRVEVYPRDPGDLGFARIGGRVRSERDAEIACEEIASDIRRHVSDLPTYGNRGVSVVWDDEPVCSHCGSRWTEPHERHNGGCCAVDCDALDAELAAASLSKEREEA